MLRNFALTVFVGFFLVASAFVVPLSSGNAGPNQVTVISET